MYVNLGVNTDEIVSGTPVPAGWYEFKIVDEPEVKPNAKKRDGMSVEDGAGDNLVLRVGLVHDDEQFSGRPFTIYLPLPSEGDDKRFVKSSGQSVLHSKAEHIVKFYKAFSGEENPQGQEVNFSVGMKAVMYLDCVIKAGETNVVNELAVFDRKKPPRAATSF